MSITWMARTDPPADVQQKVAAAIEACHRWQPVVVQRPMRETVESGVCYFIDEWPVHASAAAYQLLGCGALLGIVGFLVLRTAYRVACATYWIVRTRVGQRGRAV